jgi:transposase
MCGFHHSNDYKLNAVKLYNKLNSVRKTCEYIDYSKSALHRWLIRYFETGSVDKNKYKTRKSIITNEILESIKKLILSNPTINLTKIKKKLNNTYNIDISTSYVYYLVRYHINFTNKQVRKKYYPEKKLQTLDDDKIAFYNEIIKKGIENIISIDESSFYLNMSKNFGRSEKGKKCYKTTHKYPFVKFNFICAIKYGKIIGYNLYPKEKGGITSEKFGEFYDNFIKNKYKNHLLILDNAKFYKTLDFKNKVEKSKNKIIYSLVYNPSCNPIENLFSQLKSYVRNKSPDTFEELKFVIDKIITKKITNKHLENYFKYLFVQAESFINDHK